MTQQYEMYINGQFVAPAQANTSIPSALQMGHWLPGLAKGMPKTLIGPFKRHLPQNAHGPR